MIKDLTERKSILINEIKREKMSVILKICNNLFKEIKGILYFFFIQLSGLTILRI